MYVQRLTNRLKFYIRHCLNCQINQTLRHFSYEILNLISSSLISFYIIVINFIMKLSYTRHEFEEFDVLLTITNKFIKQVLLIFDKFIWSAKNWANIVLIAFVEHDWSILRVIISNRDVKFMSRFWKFLFKRLKIDLLIFTTYHSQTNEQFERTNQIVNIVIQYFLISHFDEDWIIVLLYLQFAMNNVISAIIKKNFNELMYDFKINDSLSLLFNELVDNFVNLRHIWRQEIQKAIDFAVIVVKSRYNNKHKFIELNVDTEIYLQLHREYVISELDNRKLLNQRVKSFIIKRRVNNLTYELNLLLIMRIHLIISIAHLESLSFNADFYKRLSLNSDLLLIVTERDLNSVYEIERLLNKQIFINKI